MRRTITITRKMLDAVAHAPDGGRSVVLSIDTGWPEFRLTEAQIMANAFARAFGKPTPYPYQYVTLEFER